MAEHKVIITTSGLGSRLGNQTKFTNKSLVRVGDKPSISHIIESYPEGTKFVVTLGHYGDHVRQFLTLTYPEKEIEYVDVDLYKGPGSSLGYSLLKCETSIDGPFVFHASDTILETNVLSENFENFVVGVKRKENSNYRTISHNKHNVLRINEKGEIGYEYAYVGVCKVSNNEHFFNNLKKFVTDGRFGAELSDVHVINSMITDGENFQFVETGTWFDIGNTGELEKTRKIFKSSANVLDKANESIYFLGDEVVKFFHDKTTNSNRVRRAKMLEGFVPQITGHSDNFYKYKKVHGETLSHNINPRNFRELLNWANNELWKEIETDGFNDKCKRFYKDKTLARINQYLDGTQDKEEVINGEVVPPIEELIGLVDFDWLSDGTPSRFHGDFILENIINDGGKFTLIDWRQDFEGDIEVGDIYYDLAKLNHNLIVNHDIVNKNWFTTQYANDADKCEIFVSSTMINCREIYHKFLSEEGFDTKKIKVLTAIIWLNMAPLHEHPFNEFLFQFGKYNLFKEIHES